MDTSSLSFPTYESIGVQPLINCRGSFTIISGSLMLPEAVQAMCEASKAYVHLDELMDRVGERSCTVTRHPVLDSVYNIVLTPPM